MADNVKIRTRMQLRVGDWISLTSNWQWYGTCCDICGTMV